MLVSNICYKDLFMWWAKTVLERLNHDAFARVLQVTLRNQDLVKLSLLNVVFIFATVLKAFSEMLERF